MDKFVDRANLQQYHTGAVKPLQQSVQTLAQWAVDVDDIVRAFGGETCPDSYIDDLINS